MTRDRIDVVGAIIRKDLVLFSRDRFYVLVTVLGLVVYAVVFWLLPSTVNETIHLGLHGSGLSQLLGPAISGAQEGVAVTDYPSTEALRDAVAGGEVAAGVDLPDGFLASVRAGRHTSVTVFADADVPPELQTAAAAFVREVAYVVAGRQLPVSMPDLEQVVLGPDRAGAQVSLQERMRPLFAFMVLLVEMLALATLVAAEIQQRTITAVLATPARLSDVLTAKAVLGTAMAFTEAILLLAATRSFGQGVVLLLVATLLGAVLVTGFGLIAGSAGRDFIGIVFWSLLFLIPLAIPAVAILFPGSAASWVRVLPSYGLVQAIIGATAYGEHLADAAGDLGMLALWCAAAFAIGLVMLRRKVATL